MTVLELINELKKYEGESEVRIVDDECAANGLFRVVSGNEWGFWMPKKSDVCLLLTK